MLQDDFRMLPLILVLYFGLAESKYKLCLLETLLGVFWQTMVTQMKSYNTQHVIRAYIVCYDKYNHQGLKYIIIC